MILLFLVSCSTEATTQQSTELSGTWEWQDIENIKNPILKKHSITFMNDKYQEMFFENDKAKGAQEGLLLMNKIGNRVEFSLTGNVQTVYKGILAYNKLMIVSTNDIEIVPPALYIRK